MDKNLLGIASLKIEGQAMNTHCLEECQGIAMRKEIAWLRRRNFDLREALEYIADMSDGWEEDEELNLMFVVDNHVKAAREALGEEE